MAFVYRSLKNLDEPIKPKNNLNYYENDMFSEIYKKFSKNSPNNQFISSFGSKALRKTLNFKDGSDSPGPGSYKIQKTFLKNSFSHNSSSPTDPEGLEGEPTHLFISKAKRFEENNKNNKENPSPCEYFKDKKIVDLKSIRKDSSHLKTFGNYSPFSSKRQISIPTNDLCYNVNNDGEIEVRTDLEKYKNNLGPGSYNINFHSKKNNSIDWSKTVKEIKDDKKEEIDNKQKKNKSIEIANNSLNISTIDYDSNLNIKTNTSTNLITHNIDCLTDKICNTEKIPKEKKGKKGIFNLKIEICPGPGDYDTTFNIDAPIKFSNVNNFGSNSSRGILYPLTKNKIRIGSKYDNNSLIIKNENIKGKNINNINNRNLTTDGKEEIKNNRLNKIINSYKLHSLYVNEIKEKYVKSKKFLNSNLGPGTYNPPLSIRNKKENDIQSFNSLDKRFKEKKDQFDYPGVGEYSTIDSFSPKKTYIKSTIPQYIIRRNSIGISAPKINEEKEKIYNDYHKSPCIGEYYPELIKSIEFNTFKAIQNYNDKKPCFNYGEKRFFEPKRKYEDDNNVGKYNLSGKEKEITQNMIPFSSNVERNDSRYFISKTIDNNKKLGPGAYRYDSYFDWNKKSYNILFA